MRFNNLNLLMQHEASHAVRETGGTQAPAPKAELEKAGDALIIPTEPASIYEHTIMARPNFDNRSPPASY